MRNISFNDKKYYTNKQKFRPIWEFTYKIVSGEEWKRVKVVNRDPDNLLVQWVPGGKTITEIFEEMNKDCRLVCILKDSSTSIIQELSHWRAICCIAVPCAIPLQNNIHLH